MPDKPAIIIYGTCNNSARKKFFNISLEKRIVEPVLRILYSKKNFIIILNANIKKYFIDMKAAKNGSITRLK